MRFTVAATVEQRLIVRPIVGTDGFDIVGADLILVLGRVCGKKPAGGGFAGGIALLPQRQEICAGISPTPAI